MLTVVAFGAGTASSLRPARINYENLYTHERVFRLPLIAFFTLVRINKPFPAFCDNRGDGNKKELFMKTKEELPDCPVATTVQLIGSKWKLLILQNLLARPWRFNELRKSLDGISQKVLTDSLRSMEADGIITRTAYPEVPPRVEYALSELGESMRPILDSMQAWGNNYKATQNN